MKNLKVTVNGKVYDVQVEEVGGAAVAAPAAAAPVAAPAAAPAPAAVTGETIDAPMAGTILDIKVKSGDAVKKGDVVIVLEAMKMENEIYAPKDCTIDSVLVAKSEAVELGKKLITIK